jgi:hypothetical protein
LLELARMLGMNIFTTGGKAFKRLHNDAKYIRLMNGISGRLMLAVCYQLKN